MLVKFKSLIKRNFQNNFIVYFTLTVIFIFGIILGSIFINRIDAQENIEISNYFNWIFKYIYEDSYKLTDIFKTSAFSNIKIILSIGLLGLISLGILIIPLIICWKGITIGFTVGFLVNEFGLKGFLLSLLGLLPHYLIMIPGLIFLSSVGLIFSLSSRRLKGNRISKKNLQEYFILIFTCLIILLLSSLVESFLTPYLFKIIKITL